MEQKSIKKREIRPHVIAVASLIIAGIIITSIAFLLNSQSDVVAVVNGEKITRDELYKLMYAKIGRDTLEELISDKLVMQEAKKRGVSVSEEEIAREIDRVKRNFSSEAEYYYTLAMYGMTEDDLKNHFRTDLLARKIIALDIKPTEEQLKAYFEDNKHLFAHGEQVRARHILVATEEEAKEAKRRLAAGEDFADLADELSLDSWSAARGGDLDYFEYEDMDPAFAAVAFALEIREISEPVETVYGWHIIQAMDRKAPFDPSFEEVRDQVLDSYMDSQVSDLAYSWMQDLRAAAKIEYTSSR